MWTIYNENLDSPQDSKIKNSANLEKMGASLYSQVTLGQGEGVEVGLRLQMMVYSTRVHVQQM